MYPTQYEVSAGFRVAAAVDEPWEGLLYRKRTLCDGSVPTEQDLNVGEGDSFHEVLTNQDDRFIYTVVPGDVTQLSQAAGTIRGPYTQSSSSFAVDKSHAHRQPARRYENTLDPERRHAHGQRPGRHRALEPSGPEPLHARSPWSTWATSTATAWTCDGPQDHHRLRHGRGGQPPAQQARRHLSLEPDRASAAQPAERGARLPELHVRRLAALDAARRPRVRTVPCTVGLVWSSWARTTASCTRSTWTPGTTRTVTYPAWPGAVGLRAARAVRQDGTR